MATMRPMGLPDTVAPDGRSRWTKPVGRAPVPQFRAGDQRAVGAGRGVAGPVVLGVAVGIDALLAGLVLVSKPTVARALLTTNGARNIHPERDTILYLAAGALAVLVAAAVARLKPVRGLPSLPPAAAAGLAVGVGAGVVVATGAAFLAVRHTLPLGGAAAHAYLALSLLLGAECVLVGKLTRHSRAPSAPEPMSMADTPAGVRPGLLDVIVPVLVIGLLYLPRAAELAGDAFYGENALHLDFFGYGPALAYRAGLSLGTDLRTYYGLGWPVVFAHLHALTYTGIIRLEAVYGCVYFIGVYAFLRVLVGDRRWAAAGTGLAVFLQMFAGFPALLVMWRFPSATIMRWPFDVWFLLACLLHLRRGRTAWPVVASVCVALALVFETDTGLALAVAFAFFWLATWRMKGAAGLRPLAWSVPAAAITLVAGLGVASRWTMLSGPFWAGWLENLRLSVAGATLLPLTTEPTTWAVVLFVVVAVTYLGWIATSLILLVGRRLTTSTVMVGMTALYGFLTLEYFVGRSSPNNLFRPAVPFAIVVAATGGLAHRAWCARPSARAGTWPAPARGAPAWAALAVVVAMMAAHPGVRTYPGLVRTALAGGPAHGICVVASPEDICGLPPEAQPTVDQFRALAAHLRRLGSAGAPVAVLDEIGPLVQSMSGARPWGRYLPTFPSLFTVAQVHDMARALREHPPLLVVMRPRAEDRVLYADTWRLLRVPVRQGFVLDGTDGPFEVWRRR